MSWTWGGCAAELHLSWICFGILALCLIAMFIANMRAALLVDNHYRLFLVRENILVEIAKVAEQKNGDLGKICELAESRWDHDAGH